MTQINKAITAVMAGIAKTGIAKNMRNQQQGFNYRGIEAAMNELNPLLVANGITVTSKYSDLQITERAKADGKATRFAIIKGAFVFAADDGSSVVAECYGEAMDSGDKAVTKAQSVAFRTALFQQFVVPTVAVDPESDDGGDDRLATDLADITKAADLKALESLWAKLGKEYTDAQDREGYKAVAQAVKAKKAALEGGAA
jgi:hypothetical protein